MFASVQALSLNLFRHWLAESELAAVFFQSGSLARLLSGFRDLHWNAPRALLSFLSACPGHALLLAREHVPELPSYVLSRLASERDDTDAVLILLEIFGNSHLWHLFSEDIVEAGSVLVGLILDCRDGAVQCKALSVLMDYLCSIPMESKTAILSRCESQLLQWVSCFEHESDLDVCQAGFDFLGLLAVKSSNLFRSLNGTEVLTNFFRFGSFSVRSAAYRVLDRLQITPTYSDLPVTESIRMLSQFETVGDPSDAVLFPDLPGSETVTDCY